MGHALHSYLSNKHQPVVDSDYVIFVAEVASTCNEALLMQYLLKKTTDKKERAYLINYFLEQFRTTLYRQTMFAEFELKMSQMVLNGESINSESACKVYHDLIDLYFGKILCMTQRLIWSGHASRTSSTTFMCISTLQDFLPRSHCPRKF